MVLTQGMSLLDEVETVSCEFGEVSDVSVTDRFTMEGHIEQERQ
jgi:hypothetical protein